MNRVAHLRSLICLEIHVQPIASGSVRIQDCERSLCRPVRAALQILQRPVQPLLHSRVVIGKALLLNIHGNQLQNPYTVSQLCLRILNLQAFVLVNDFTHIRSPVRAHYRLLRCKGLSYVHDYGRHSENHYQQNRQYDYQPLYSPSAFVAFVAFFAFHSFSFSPCILFIRRQNSLFLKNLSDAEIPISVNQIIMFFL